MNTQGHIKTGSEEQVWNAISAFEEILQVMPDDRVALETLYEAHCMLGDQVKSSNYLFHLARVVADDKDSEAVAPLLPALRALKDDPQALDLLQELESLAHQHQPPVLTPQLISKPAVTKTRTGDLTAELALAWNLLQAKELHDEEYRLLVQELSDCISRKLTSPVTVLHVLQDQESPKLRSIMSYIAKDTRTPPIGLKNFDIQKRIDPALNPGPQIKRGALVFDRLGKDYMVGLLNPYDRDLAQHVTEALGATCHFYLISAEDFDRAAKTLASNAD